MMVSVFMAIEWSWPAMKRPMSTLVTKCRIGMNWVLKSTNGVDLQMGLTTSLDIKNWVLKSLLSGKSKISLKVSIVSSL